MAEPVRYDPALEVIAEDEMRTEQGLIETLEKIQNRVYEDSGAATRGVHAKCHGIITGELAIAKDLPAVYAQGLFAEPRSYPVVIRLSTIPGDVLDDSVSVPRGLALKVVGVPGARVRGSEGESTQDFVLANGPAFAKPNAHGFLNDLKLVAATTDRVPGLKHALSVVMRGAEKLLEAAGLQSSAVMRLGGYPATHILGDEFYSQAPVLFGAYMAKFRLVPGSPELQTLQGARLDLSSSANAIREAVISHFATHGAEWDLQAQLCTDVIRMPIEDASMEWSQADSPYLTVARVAAPPQQVWGPARREADAALSFTPWHALAAHRPLGGIMRVRRRAYAVTAALRAQRSGHELREPATLTDLPA